MSATRKSLTAPKVGRVKLTTGSRVEYAVTSGTDRKKVLGTIVYGPGPFHLKPNENDWCGVTLDEPYGKNNGTIQGRQYFECADNFGLFVRANTLKLVREKKSGSGSTTPCKSFEFCFENLIGMCMFGSHNSFDDSIFLNCILHGNVRLWTIVFSATDKL